MSTKKHTIYVIQEGTQGKSYWNRAGVAFLNKDGSFTLKLDILPQTKFQLREERLAAAVVGEPHQGLGGRAELLAPGGHQQLAHPVHRHHAGEAVGGRQVAQPPGQCLGFLFGDNEFLVSLPDFLGLLRDTGTQELSLPT